jgi:hypothetical protein
VKVECVREVFRGLFMPVISPFSVPSVVPSVAADSMACRVSGFETLVSGSTTRWRNVHGVILRQGSKLLANPVGAGEGAV